MNNLSNQLINLRKKLGLTQKQLADKVGIDQTMISDYEMGKFIPSQRTINKFAKQGIIIDLDGQVAQIRDYEVEEVSEVSKQLINLRRSLKISQSELAELVGVHKNTISRIERKEVFPDPATLQKFVDNKIDLNQYNEDSEMSVIAKQVIKIRENLGLNQGQFARKIGVSQATLCEIESGKRQLTTTTLRKIKDKTGVSLDLKVPINNQIQTAAKEISDKFGITWYNKKEEVVMSNEIGKIVFTFNIANKTFELKYSSHEYENNTYTYTLIINQEYFDFLKFLSIHYPSQVRNMKVDNVEKVLLLISHNNTNYFYTLQIKGNTFTGIVTFKPSNFEDIFEKATKEVVEKEVTEMTKELMLEDSNKSNPNRDILILCQNIIQIRDLLDETLELAQKVVQPIVDKEKEVVEAKKERQIKEVVHKVYKQVFWGQSYIYIGTKTLNDGIIFRVAPELKESQGDWGLYEFGFLYQTETTFDDGTVELGNKEVFVPSTKIQEIESSDRKGVIGYVEHKAGIVEVIYYDRFVN